jgi:hypothetical protein
MCRPYHSRTYKFKGAWNAKGAGVAQSVSCLAMDWTTGLSRFDPWQRKEIFPLASMSRPALGPTQPPVQWVPVVLLPEVKHSWGMMLTTYPQLVLRSRMSRSYTSSCPLRFHTCVMGLLYLWNAKDGWCKHLCLSWDFNQQPCWPTPHHFGLILMLLQFIHLHFEYKRVKVKLQWIWSLNLMLLASGWHVYVFKSCQEY